MSSPNRSFSVSRAYAGEFHLVLADVVHPEVLEELDGGAEADRLGDRRSAGLELRRAPAPS